MVRMRRRRAARPSVPAVSWWWRHLLPVAVWAALILVVAARPAATLLPDHLTEPGASRRWIQYPYHVGAFAVLGLLLERCVRAARSRRSWTRVAGTALLAAAALSALSELIQVWAPTRTPALRDVALDLFGATLGIGAGLAASRSDGGRPPPAAPHAAVWRRLRWPAALLVAVIAVGVAARALAVEATPIGGFGASTPGGAGQPIYRVSSLANAGPGTLRDALSRGYRLVQFDVAGVIELASPLHVQGPFVTIDGFSAPPPGITLQGSGLVIRLDRRPGGAHDVIVRGVRVRRAESSRATDCISIGHGAFNVVLHHVSTSGCADGSIDITHGARDVTVAWSIVSNREKTVLIGYGAHRVTMHHNVVVDGKTRNPYVTCGSDAPSGPSACADLAAADTILDFRNNIVWRWGDHGIRVRHGARVNVVNNLFGSPDASRPARRRAIVICRGDGVETPDTRRRCNEGRPSARAYGYAAGNVSLDGVDLSPAGTVPTPFPAPAPPATPACEAAHEVAARAGVRPLDAIDDAHLGGLLLPSCADAS
jgi:VanZ family protein